MMNYCIETKNLTKRYGNYNAVNHVNFHLEKGKIYGLIGKNGAGKSTLIKLLMGLSRPTSGQVEMFGTSKNLHKQRANIGFMMADNFYPYLSAKQNLHYFRKIKGIKDKKEVDRVLKLVELDGVKKPFKAYSLGMKQRLSLANALMGYPDIILMDEPINGLDPQGIADFRRMILKINQEEKTTFLISSHILSELDKVAHVFGFIDQGKLLAELSHEEIEQKCGQYLMVETDRLVEARADLLNHFNFEKVELSDNQLKVYGQTVESHEIAKYLVDRGYKLQRLAYNRLTLEDFFLQLIGGHNHV